MYLPGKVIRIRQIGRPRRSGGAVGVDGLRARHDQAVATWRHVQSMAFKRTYTR